MSTGTDPTGRIIGTAQNLRFVEWDLAQDRHVSSACVDVMSVSFNAGWNADRGVECP
ncbi:MAG: hypothetical protein ACO1OB_00195 [Archangium sp.]